MQNLTLLQLNRIVAAYTDSVSADRVSVVHAPADFKPKATRRSSRILVQPRVVHAGSGVGVRLDHRPRGVHAWAAGGLVNGDHLMSLIAGELSEPKLIALAYAWEQATKVRKPPKFLPSVPVDTAGTHTGRGPASASTIELRRRP